MSKIPDLTLRRAARVAKAFATTCQRQARIFGSLGTLDPPPSLDRLIFICRRALAPLRDVVSIAWTEAEALERDALALPLSKAVVLRKIVADLRDQARRGSTLLLKIEKRIGEMEAEDRDLPF